MLEKTQHSDSIFLTLTYDEEHHPKDGSLVPDHLRDFLKRLRKKVSPLRLRYYGVGEYGEKNFRPHYHLAVFGHVPCLRGRTIHFATRPCCAVCAGVAATWGNGGVDLGELSLESAGYLVGYVTKAMTSTDDPRLEGRHPEFARMSLKPGIGAGFAPEIASTVMQHGLDQAVDVPRALGGQGRRILPLGRYLTREVRKHVGMAPQTPQATLEAIQQEMQPLREAAEAAAGPYGQGKSKALKELVIKEGNGRYNQLVAKQRIYKRRGDF